MVKPSETSSRKARVVKRYAPMRANLGGCNTHWYMSEKGGITLGSLDSLVLFWENLGSGCLSEHSKIAWSPKAFVTVGLGQLILERETQEKEMGWKQDTWNVTVALNWFHIILCSHRVAPLMGPKRRRHASSSDEDMSLHGRLPGIEPGTSRTLSENHTARP